MILAMVKTLLKYILIAVLILGLTTTTIRISPKNKHDHITYVAIGDSITEGLLATRELSVTNGYYGYVADALRNSGYEIDAYNYAKSGATSPEILAQLHVVNRELQTPDILTMSAGINDLIAQLRPIQSKKFQEKYSDAKQTIQQYSDSTTELPIAWKETEKQLERMQHHLTSVHLFFDKNSDAFERKGQKTNTEKEVNTIAEMVEENVSNFNQNIVKLNQAYDELEEDATVTDLAQEVRNAEKALVKLEASLKKQAKKTSKNEVSSQSKEIYDQYIELLKVTKTEISHSLKVLTDFHETLNYIHFMQEKAFAARDTIKSSKQKIDTAFNLAFDEIEATKNNIRFIIELAQRENPNIDIFVLEYYNMVPYASQGIQDRTVELITTLNEAIEDVTKETHTVYVPSYETFAEDYDAFLPNEDNIHPGQDGYQALANQFIMKINEAYPSANPEKIEE